MTKLATLVSKKLITAPSAAAAGIVLFACLGAFWIGYISKRPANRGLVIADRYLFLGDQWEQNALQWPLAIANPTTNTVEILEFITSCGCASVVPPSLVVGPGKEATVYLTLDLRAGKQLDHPSPVRDFTVRLVPRIKQGGIQEEGWRIKAQVRSPLLFSPPSLDFRQDFVRGQPFVGKTVQIATYTKITDLKPTFDNDGLHVRIVRSTARPDRFHMEVTPRDNLPPGPFTFDVSVRAVVDHAKELPPQVLQVAGNVEEDIQMFPASILWGVQAIGTSTDQCVLLRSVTGKDFSTDGFHTSSEEFSVEVVDNPAQQNSFRVRLIAARAGNRAGHVKFAVKTEGALQAQTLTLPVSYYGMVVSAPH